MNKDKTKCDHNCDHIKWVYREYDDSMWDVTTCDDCKGAIANVMNTDYNVNDYEPGFNHTESLTLG